MRRIQEIRMNRSKPKLSDLMKGLKTGDHLKKMEIKKKILALYEFDEDEKENKQVKKDNDLRKFMDKDDALEKNQTFLNMKLRIKKVISELD